MARALFAHSPFATALCDTDGWIVDANAAFERLFGSISSSHRRYSLLTDARLDAEGHLPAVRRALAGELIALPAMPYDADGRRRWLEAHILPVQDDAGAVTALVLKYIDLTERIEAEEASRRSEERLRVALDAGRMGAWEWDVAAGRIHWSDTLQRIHGLVPGAFQGTFDEYQREIHPEDRERVLGQIPRSLEGAEHHLEYRIVRPDGEVRWLDARGELFRDGDGRPVRMLGVCTDVTARKRLELEAEAARQRLEEQTAELESQAEQLQAQASDLEAQQAELEQRTAELQAINEELRQTNDELGIALERAERAEANVRGILGGIGDPFVVLDAEWCFRYVNDAAAAVFARTGHPDVSAVMGRSLWDAYPHLLGTSLEQAMRRAQQQGVLSTFTEFTASSGTWTEVRCYPMPGGGVANLWKDVTAERKADEARHYLGRTAEILAVSLDEDETVQHLARLLVPDLADWCAVELLDEAGTLRQAAVAHVDPAKIEWARELNRRYPPDPAMRTGTHEVVRTGRSLLYAEIPEALLVAGAQDEEHLRILREIGFSSALIVPLEARGRTIGALTLVSAESRRRYGETELRLAEELAARAALAVDNAQLYSASLRARAEADEANRMKAEFLANISHELRTPLNAIGGYVQLIELGVHGPVTDPQREALARVQRNQQHLLSLINDVLNFAKIEAGSLAYDVTPLEVAGVLAELEPLVAPQLAAKRLRYECDTGPGLPTVLADAERLRQVLLNLLSNAIKFTPEEGCVRVTAASEGNEVLVAVHDTGIGIPADKHASVFEPFVQLSRKGTPGNEGTGLGLAISRDLVRGMGGDLTIESAVGAGSTFTIHLPRGA